MSKIRAKLDSGTYNDINATTDGHLEVAIHSPRLPFGSVNTESLTAVFQTDAVYGVNSGQVSAKSSGTGSATATDSRFVVSTGATQYSQGIIQSRKRLRYRPGQGILGRFAGYFSTPAEGGYQIAGFGHAEDGVYFGYKDAQFGILYVNRGSREVRTLTVTVASSHAENVTVTLNGVAHTVAVTNSANIQRTVYEISRGTYAGWSCYPSGATVIFVRDAAGTASGTYSITGTSAAGTFAQTKAGAASTDLFVPQSQWNGDKLDGTGLSGYTINPQKGNVFQIGIQYLGFGSIQFQVETYADNQNNPEFVNVHTLRLPNTLTATSFGNPSYPFTMAAYSAGSTSNISVSVGSFGGFIEGRKVMHGNRFSYFNSSTGVTSAAYLPLFTIMNGLYYGGRVNQSVINILTVAAAIKHSNPVIIYLIRNGTLTGNPNFTSYASNSCSFWDTAATGVTWATNDQLIWTGHMGDTGNILYEFPSEIQELTLQPGEYITVAARSLGAGSPAFVTASLNTREDQ